jgi:2-oxoglutarate ferredoxin oxidoreductase subunit gamma
MRGGTANCTVIIADAPIASPIVTNPRDAVVMNRPSLEKFGPHLKPGGFVIINTSLISVRPDRSDLVVVEVPANQIAIEAGAGKAANMVMLGTYVGATGIVPREALTQQAEREFAKKPKLVPVNVKCLDSGYRLGEACRRR